MGAEEYSNPLAPVHRQREGGGTPAGGGSGGHPNTAWQQALSGSTLDPVGVIRLVRTLVDADGRVSPGISPPSPNPSR